MNRYYENHKDRDNNKKYYNQGFSNINKQQPKRYNNWGHESKKSVQPSDNNKKNNYSYREDMDFRYYNNHDSRKSSSRHQNYNWQNDKMRYPSFCYDSDENNGDEMYDKYNELS